MASRKQATARAIAESVELSQGGKPKEADPPPKPRGVSNAGLYSTWGAKDLHTFFRFPSGSLGFKAQALAVQAETIGKRLTPFWDDANAAAARHPKRESSRLLGMLKAAKLKVDRARARYEKLPLAKNSKALELAERAVIACELALDTSSDDAPGGVDAMPTAGREVRSVASPEGKITDDSIAAVTDLRRIEAGLALLGVPLDKEGKPIAGAPRDMRPMSMLETVFTPPRTHPQIEAIFQELSFLVLNDLTLNEAFDAAMAMSRRRIPIEAWLVQRLDAEESKRVFKMDTWRDTIIDGAVTRAEEAALAAVHAYESVTREPPDVREQRERKEREAERKAQAAELKAAGKKGHVRTRRRRSVVDLIVPDAFESQI